MSISGLQVKQKNVSESSHASEFCGFGTADPSGRDCVSVPPHSMQELHNEGTQIRPRINTLVAWLVLVMQSKSKLVKILRSLHL